MFYLNEWTLSISALLCALLLDHVLGEPRRFHPLIGFGRLASALEQRLNKGPLLPIKGVLAWCLCILPLALITHLLSILLASHALAYFLFSASVVYLCIGWRSLLEHATAVSSALHAKQLEAGREAVARIVSRDCEQLTAPEIAKAATESVLENGADALFAALFWFLIAGLPGVVVYRAANTLDAMWGYKTERFKAFGWAAARLDDVLNYLPARLTALSYALVGKSSSALRCWQHQGKHWKSPNAGPVMAAGAGAIHASLGGPAVYHGSLQNRPLLGLDPVQAGPCDAPTVGAACSLINKSLLLWSLLLIISASLLELLR